MNIPSILGKHSPFHVCNEIFEFCDIYIYICLLCVYIMRACGQHVQSRKQKPKINNMSDRASVIVSD